MCVCGNSSPRLLPARSNQFYFSPLQLPHLPLGLQANTFPPSDPYQFGQPIRARFHCPPDWQEVTNVTMTGNDQSINPLPALKHTIADLFIVSITPGLLVRGRRFLFSPRSTTAATQAGHNKADSQQQPNPTHYNGVLSGRGGSPPPPPHGPLSSERASEDGSFSSRGKA